MLMLHAILNYIHVKFDVVCTFQIYINKYLNFTGQHDLCPHEKDFQYKFYAASHFFYIHRFLTTTPLEEFLQHGVINFKNTCVRLWEFPHTMLEVMRYPHPHIQFKYRVALKQGQVRVFLKRDAIKG